MNINQLNIKILQFIFNSLKTIFLVFLLLQSILLYSQNNTSKELEQYFNMSLEELMNVKVTIASKKAMTQRDAPGIISVITAEEIQNSGASDLIDVLRLVPGVEMVVDVWGATGISIRGNLGYTGRVSLMIDGQETNELLYGCSFIGNHYPVNNIKRIEIIRGPGSSMYGGFAEFGVINVITKTGEDLNGISASVNYGSMSGDASHLNTTLSAGKKINDFEFAIHGFYGKGNRSDREYIDAYGSLFDMSNQAELNPTLINTSLSYKDLSARFIYDNYETTSRDWNDAIVAKDYNVVFKTLFGELKYDWKISDKLTITPKYNFKHNTPWNSMENGISGDDIFYQYEIQIIRNRINLTASLDLNENINLIAGGEYYIDNAQNNLGDNFWNGKSEIDYNNISGFAQGILKSNIANITFGGRIDKHSEYGAAFSPRLGLTKVFDKLHLKLLYSQAFRSPVIDEIEYNLEFDPTLSEPNLVPEQTQVIEFEAGYQFTEDMAFTANVYHIRVDNTIVFSYGANGDGYDNRGISGSKGFELEYRLRKKWGYATLNYSYYNAKDINEIDYYAVKDKEELLMGTSPHKITLNSSFKIFRELRINPSVVYMGERYAYTHYDEALKDMVFSAQDPIVLVNLYINYKNLFTKGLNFGVGVYNLLDAKYDFIEPYNGWHPPLPGHSRKFVMKIAYNFKYKK